MMACRYRNSLEDARENLKQWGHWLRVTQNYSGGSGVISMYDERIGGDAQGLALTPDDDIAERVEQILCRVKQQQPKVFRVLWWWYYAEGSIEEIANHMRIGQTTVKHCRMIGETAVASYWDAGYRG